MNRTAPAQHPSPSFVISTSDFDPTSSSRKDLAEADAAADSATRLEPETEGQEVKDE